METSQFENHSLESMTVETVKNEFLGVVTLFFTLTERKSTFEQREAISEELGPEIKNRFGKLTLEDIKAATKRGAMCRYGEVKRFDSLASVLPNFLKLYIDEQKQERASLGAEADMSKMTDQEKKIYLVEKGEIVFKDHILLFIKRYRCFQDLPSAIGPDFDKTAFDTYVNNTVMDVNYQTWYMSSFDEEKMKQWLIKRLKTEKDLLYGSDHEVKGSKLTAHLKKYDPKKMADATFNHYLKVISVYEYLKYLKVKFKTPAQYFTEKGIPFK